MNNQKKIFLCISIPILLLLLIILLVEIRTSIALNDYSLLPSKPKVIDKIVLGRRDRGFHQGLYHAYRLEFGEGILRAFRRGSIELVCTEIGNVKLIMRAFKPRTETTDEAYFHTSFRIENGVAKGEAHIEEMRSGSAGYFDNFESKPLNDIEIKAILKALAERTPGDDHIGLSTMDGGNGFRGNAKLSDVKILIDRCKKDR
jgi:hypothetical protein